MMPDLIAFLNGALAVSCLAVGLVFLKFWRVSRDRFFVFFASAFWAIALGSTLRTVLSRESDHGYLVFLPRLVGFVIIAIAILDKNRRDTDTD